jgi:hypothetical protein
MGSKEKDTPGNFNERDSKIINNSPQSKASRSEVKSFIQSQAPKKPEVVGGSGGLAAVGGLIGGAAKTATKIFSAFSNAGKQYAKHGASKTIALRNAGVTSAKDMRYADKSWTASAIIKTPSDGNFREIANAKLRRGLNKGDKKDLTY